MLESIKSIWDYIVFDITEWWHFHLVKKANLTQAQFRKARRLLYTSKIRNQTKLHHKLCQKRQAQFAEYIDKNRHLLLIDEHVGLEDKLSLLEFSFYSDTEFIVFAILNVFEKMPTEKRINFFNHPKKYGYAYSALRFPNQKIFEKLITLGARLREDEINQYHNLDSNSHIVQKLQFYQSYIIGLEKTHLDSMIENNHETIKQRIKV
jgi:hypothetical protein